MTVASRRILVFTAATLFVLLLTIAWSVKHDADRDSRDAVELQQQIKLEAGDGKPMGVK